VLFRSRNDGELARLAGCLRDALRDEGVESQVVASEGQAGGGTLPDVRLPGYAVVVSTTAARAAEGLYRRLLRLDRPVVGILRQGQVCLDVRTLDEADIPYVAQAVALALRGGAG
jgi:L-seryl-tRNA(Ser) seleniumtransferase